MKELRSNTESPLFSPFQAILIFLGFVAAVLIISFIKKIYYRFYKYKRYYIFPRIGVKGITNIAMTISLSISIILLLTVITSGLLGILFRAYPGWRVTIEGLLIQLGGLLFGPIVGLFIGGLTDLLSIALTAGMFHYGYFIASLAYGLFSGLIRMLISLFKNNIVNFSIVSTIFVSLLFAAFSMFIEYQNYDVFKITLFAQDIVLNKAALIGYTGVIFGAVLLVIWTILPIYNYKRLSILIKRCKYNIRYGSWLYYYKKKLNLSKNKTKIAFDQGRWLAKNLVNIINLNKKMENLKQDVANGKNLANWFDYLCPVLFLGLSGEFFISSFLLPFFDIDFSAFAYDYWLGSRIIIFPVILVVNIALVFPAYKVVAKLVKYDYQIDMIESINKPYMN